MNGKYVYDIQKSTPHASLCWDVGNSVGQVTFHEVASDLISLCIFTAVLHSHRSSISGIPYVCKSSCVHLRPCMQLTANFSKPGIPPNETEILRLVSKIIKNFADVSPSLIHLSPYFVSVHARKVLSLPSTSPEVIATISNRTETKRPLHAVTQSHLVLKRCAAGGHNIFYAVGCRDTSDAGADRLAGRI